MKINVAKSAGFCFGVKRALNIASKTASSEKNVCMLGDIVHNEDVVKKISKNGIKKIKRLSSGKGKTLIIRAHGASKDIFKKAKRLNYKIVDATCLMVKEIHKIAKEKERQGYKIIVIGDKKHDEVKGIAGQLNKKALVIDTVKNIPSETQLRKIKKAAVVVQSTQNIEKVEKIIKCLQKKIDNIKFYNTICQPTRNKQQEARAMPLKNDVMIVIGSKTSANTKRLYQISKSLNKKTHWIQHDKDIKKEWFKNAESVGITAGASTPDKTTKKVVKIVKTLAT
jgi:4-hydroxy-3-methylbut-2-enyl diphosphate reductase